MAIVIIIPKAHILQTVWVQSPITVDHLCKIQGTTIRQRLVDKTRHPFLFSASSFSLPLPHPSLPLPQIFNYLFGVCVYMCCVLCSSRCMTNMCGG